MEAIAIRLEASRFRKICTVFDSSDLISDDVTFRNSICFSLSIQAGLAFGTQNLLGVQGPERGCVFYGSPFIPFYAGYQQEDGSEKKEERKTGGKATKWNGREGKENTLR